MVLANEATLKVESVGNAVGRTSMALSAKDGLQLDALKKQLVDWVQQHPSYRQGMIVSNARHVEALKATLQSLESISEGMSQGLSGDLLAIDIRMALFHLGSITGQVEVDRDILGTIFGKFCIGK